MDTQVNNLSFFGKELRIHPILKRTHNGASYIRAQQIAEYLGAKFNPKEGFENDICIYVKPNGHENFAKNSYIDVVDGNTLIPWLKQRPQFPVIAASESAYEYMKKHLTNKIILIPQHHCNFERFKRNRKVIDTVGIIGIDSSFMYDFNEIEERLKKIGMKLFKGFEYKNREDVCNLYKQIDIQITWRTLNMPLKNPLKLYNAASFGIPTVGYQEDCYKEMEGYYIPVKTIDELIEKVDKLKEVCYYTEYANKIAEKAEFWHIDNIAKLYKQL